MFWIEDLCKSYAYDLGVLYDNGKGVAQDHNKALEWHEKAAN